MVITDQEKHCFFTALILWQDTLNFKHKESSETLILSLIKHLGENNVSRHYGFIHNIQCKQWGKQSSNMGSRKNTWIQYKYFWESHLHGFLAIIHNVLVYLGIVHLIPIITGKNKEQNSYIYISTATLSKSPSDYKIISICTFYENIAKSLTIWKVLWDLWMNDAIWMSDTIIILQLVIWSCTKFN